MSTRIVPRIVLVAAVSLILIGGCPLITPPSVNAPTVSTSTVTDITTTTASGGGNVTDNGGADVTARGVCWSTSANPTINDSKTSDGTGTGVFTSQITGLTADTTYHVRAYATNSAGTGYGEDVEFTTATGIPDAFTNASVVRGGLLYDNWWETAEVAEPTGDHAFWATRPDTTSNTRTGSVTWRCKECHGWDYKGVDGAYGSGSHRTGFAGVYGATGTVQELFDLIKTGHGFGAAGLGDDDIWDLVKFVKEGVIDTDTIIDANKNFLGDATAGQALYASAFGGNIACSLCHGADGRQINFASDPAKEYVGTIAVGNPWEFQHKVRFGQPGTLMPAMIDAGGTNDDVADLGAYSQSLPTE